MAEKKIRRPVEIKEVLPGILEKFSPGGSLQEALLKDWPRLLPAVTGRQSRPLMIKQGVLLIGVSNSSCLQELVLRKKELLEKLLRQYGPGKITGLRFKITADVSLG